MNISEAIAAAAVRLTSRKVPDARLDAELLLGHALGRDRAWLVAHYPDEMEPRALLVYERLLDRRAAREPLQYITGRQEFWGLEFLVSPAVLVPRPETELVVESALRSLQAVPAPLIIDLCTGSGCIAVSLARELPGSRVFALDRSGDALEAARENARRHAVADRIRLLEGDLFAPLAELDLAGKVDLVSANPPYIRTGELASLQPEVRDFEPEVALIAGPRGTEIAERIIAEAPGCLRGGGCLVMEMGMGQAGELKRFAAGTGLYSAIAILKDLAGIERVIVAKKK